MRVRVIKQHLGEGSFPTFAKGSAVTIGEECTHFPHWYPCSIQDSETYVPESFVHAGELMRDYNPTELVAEVGDVLEVHEIVYAWLFAVNAKGVSGWIPAESVLSEGITDSSTTTNFTMSTKDFSHCIDLDNNLLDKTHIHLHEWIIEDALDLAVAISNKKVLDNLRDGIPYPYSEKDAVEFITATLAAEKDSQYAFAICCDDKVIGSIGVFRKDNVHRLTAEMGYYIAELYWGKGIMTEAVRQMCDFVFANTDIVRIFAEPYAFNTASCRVLEKAGFQFEGILRQNAIKNGQSVDMRMYAIIKDSGYTASAKGV
jgi:RimJ/RimL family protein N-acetyltransferase